MMVDEQLRTESLLFDEGYRLAEDDWATSGRRTYLHDEDATKQQLARLRQVLARNGWEPHRTIVRAFSRPRGDQIIEVEPGGADTSGHFLHHMRGAERFS